MQKLKRIALIALLAGAVPAAAVAQPAWQDKTTLTFDAAVQVPGLTLEPGSYLFQLARTQGSRQIVQIWDEDRTKLFTTTITVPVSRTDATGDVVVKFASTVPGEPPAVKSWFYPGDTRGHQFVYPEQQARQIAKTSRELVLSGDVDHLESEAPDTAGATEFTLIDEQGRRQPFETHRPPAVAAAAGDAEEGSGRVRVHGLEGDEAVEHHLSQIERLADVSAGAASETGAAVGTSGEAAAGSHRADAEETGPASGEMVTIPRAHLEQIREHARKARQELARDE